MHYASFGIYGNRESNKNTTYKTFLISHTKITVNVTTNRNSLF